MAEQTGGRPEDKFPKYSTYADRLTTFGSWPSSNHQQPSKLAEAGFFYQGHEDRVICYSCGEELSGWTPEDNAWAEHEKFHPTCRHVRQHKMGTMNLGNNHETVEEEIKRLRRQFQCKTCFKERVCMVLLPCTHLSACALCAEKLENCNVCHQPINSTIKAYCA